MKTSELTNELDAALSAFQGEMPVIKKDVNVNMNGLSKSGKEFKVNYDYAPLESIQAIANPLLAKHGLSITQNLGFNEFGPMVFTRVAHKSGQWMMSSFPLDFTGVTKEQDKGSKITYTRRYSFVAALNIALSDEDNDAVDVKVEPKKAQAKPQPSQLNDPADYVINLGPKNKLTGTKVKDHSIEFLNKAVEDSLKWYADNKKDPHPNVLELKDKLSQMVPF